MVQLSHPYLTIGKTRALTIQTLVSKVMSPLFNTLWMVTATMKLKDACSLEEKL